MNLGKLLGAGKSFMSGQRAAAYRADKRVYLPQFGSPKNPFANPSPVEPPKASPEKFAAMKAPSPARAMMWTAKLNPVAIFREATAPANHAAAPVQAELSLEKIKVVHNDLTDAEVEIVPIKSRPAREPATPAKKPWAELGERIMKATAL